MKKLLWIFLVIPVFAEVINTVLFLLGIGPLVLNIYPSANLLYLCEVLFSIIVYIILNKLIQTKCGFAFHITNVYKNELVKKEKLWLILKQNGKELLLLGLILCGTVAFHAIKNYDNYLTTPFLNSLFNILASFIAAFYEEFIFRKMYYEYISEKKIKYPLLLNVLCFSFLHLIPYPHIIIIGAILAYAYEKYNSLLLNFIIHFLVDLLSSFILPVAFKLIHI